MAMVTPLVMLVTDGSLFYGGIFTMAASFNVSYATDTSQYFNQNQACPSGEPA
jgi:hypothetical protein